ncbi:hypothetical protein [Immundisolibacter sp.]
MNSPDRNFVVDAGHPRPHGWLHRLGAVLWPSFLTAAVATTAFFANVDPEGLRLASFPDWQINREVGYTVGFFMFWAVTALSSFTTVVLLEPARQKIRSPHA